MKVLVGSVGCFAVSGKRGVGAISKVDSSLCESRPIRGLTHGAVAAMMCVHLAAYPSGLRERIANP